METYAYMILSLLAGFSLLLMPYIIKKIEILIGSDKSKSMKAR